MQACAIPPWQHSPGSCPYSREKKGSAYPPPSPPRRTSPSFRPTLLFQDDRPSAPQAVPFHRLGHLFSLRDVLRPWRTSTPFDARSNLQAGQRFRRHVRNGGNVKPGNSKKRDPAESSPQGLSCCVNHLVQLLADRGHRSSVVVIEVDLLRRNAGSAGGDAEDCACCAGIHRLGPDGRHA